MANNVYQQQQQQQHNGNPHHCKECGLYLNSAESLEVHLQYHKENLLSKWATQAASSTHGDEANNNSTKQPPSSISSSAAVQQSNVIVKREFVSTTTVAAAADSSDAMIKRSPEYSSNTGNRATPDTSASFGHPPTPQSYHSASSPYQTPDNSAFSPNFPSYGTKSGDRGSPATSHHLHFQQQQQAAPVGAAYGQYGEQHYFQLENPGGYNPDYPVHKMGVGTVQSFHRYHPYGNHPQQHHTYDRSNVTSQVSSSSPASGSSYPPQPTPSPSPKQCDKCGFVCESASQLTEHLTVAHPPNITSGPQHQPPPSGFTQSGQNQQQYFSSDLHVKSEEETQSEILDLDSHKVHQIYQEDDKQQRPNGELSNGHNPHSVTAMLNPWPHHHQQKMFSPTERVFNNGAVPDFINGANNVPTTTTPEMPYRPFEQSNSASSISSTQMTGGTTNAVSPASTTAPPPATKAANWKSNEARRPKTYNCTACNKWFTSSGHLKRHYNTTLHKNAVKSSNQPDPATMPISAHHHPARDSASNREDLSSNSPTDDSRSEDCFERTAMIQQQQQAASYDRQQAPNILHSLHSPMQQHIPPPQQQTSLPGSPPNGEAGPSASTNLGDSRGGLLSTTNTNNSTTSINNITSSNNSGSSSNSPLHLMHQHHGGYQLPQMVTEPPPAPPPPLGLHPPPSLHPHHHMQAANTSPMVAAAAAAHPHTHHQFQMYPNECAPHVTQAMVISSLSTTGKQEQPIPSTTETASDRSSTPTRICMSPIDIKSEVVDDEVEYCAPDQQQQKHNEMITTDSINNVQPLPSFAHIQLNRYHGNMLLNYGAANVGGSPGLITTTAPLTQYYTINNCPPPQQLLLPLQQVQEWDHPEREEHTTEPIHYEADYKLTILGPSNGLSFNTEDSNPTDAITVTTAAISAANVCNGAITGGGDASYHVIEDDSEDKFKPTEAAKPIRAASPEKAKTKREPGATARKQSAKSRKGGYEESSPTISSTTVLKDAQLNSQKGTIHKCYECDKLFNKSCYLTQHNKTFHSGDKPFKCGRCGKRFSWETQYTDHLSKHAGEKPHKCDLCPKQFNHKTDLRRHMCLHTGQKPYACDTCGKGFIRKDHMIKHCETHLRKTVKTTKVTCEVALVN